MPSAWNLTSCLSLSNISTVGEPYSTGLFWRCLAYSSCLVAGCAMRWLSQLSITCAHAPRVTQTGLSERAAGAGPGLPVFGTRAPCRDGACEVEQ